MTPPKLPACFGGLLDILEASGAAPALLSPGGNVLPAGSLAAQARRTGGFLRSIGLGPSARVAAALQNGPEAAAAFLAFAAHLAYAPLNPALKEEEFALYLPLLRADALLLRAGQDGPARLAACRLGLPILELHATPGAPAGSFTLTVDDPPGPPVPVDDPPTGETIALVLLTSGTTARPKAVPLRQRHLLAAGRNTCAVLELGPTDRCLNLMPLFHLSGLVTAVLGSLLGGGSILCPPGYAAASFFLWLEAERPTWCTAVPTIHDAIAGLASRHPERARGTSLRQLRASAAPIAPGLAERLEALFGAPLIVSYGLTETQLIASNPLPPQERRQGSVGLPAGPEVVIADAQGRILPPGIVGEILVRGETVFDGYEAAPEENAAAFVDGWFRTGDLGRFDADGYLYLEGRAKDLINRGGLKVAPAEVESVLRAHPGVREAVAFALPHTSLGEVVAAAVVPVAAGGPGEAALVAHAADRLAPHKVPVRILQVPAIPVGETGKIQRRLLANRWRKELQAAPTQAGASTAAEDWQEADATGAVLSRLPGIRRSAVLPRRDARGNLHLVAFAEFGPGAPAGPPTALLLQERADVRLPSAFFSMPALPLDSQGNLDLDALAAVPVNLEPPAAPREIGERILARLWSEVLQLQQPGLDDDFFLAGGDSLKATELLMLVEQELGIAITPEAFARRPRLGALFERLEAASSIGDSALVEIQPGSSRPFFFLHGDYNGGGFHCPRLASLIGGKRPFYTFRPDGLPGQPLPSSIEAMAMRYLALLLAVQPRGPFALGGYCNGGLVAFEMACRLAQTGATIEPLILVSPPATHRLGTAHGPGTLPLGVRLDRQPPQIRRAMLGNLYAHVIHAYRPGRFPGTLHLLGTSEDLSGGLAEGWGKLAGTVHSWPVPGDHRGIFADHLDTVARRLKTILDGAPSRFPQ